MTRSILRAFSGGLQTFARVVPRGPVQVDWSHPLANGLIGCYLPGVSGGINLTGMGGDLTSVSPPDETSGTTIEGPGIHTTKTGDGLRGLAPPAFLGPNNSYYWRGTPIAPSLMSGSPLIGIQYSDPESSPFMFQAVGVEFASGGQINVELNSGGSFTQSSGTTPTANVQVGYLGTFPVGGTATLYKDGVSNATVSYATASTSSITATICIHFSTSDPLRVINATCNVGYIWNRVLSADEASFLDADPYCFLIPQEWEMPALFNPVVLVSGLGNGLTRQPNLLPPVARRLPPAVQAGITAWWPLDNNNTDFGNPNASAFSISRPVVGNNFATGNTTGGAVGGPPFNGGGSGFASFDGTTNFGLTLNADPVNGTVPTAFTAASWVYLNSYVTDGGTQDGRIFAFAADFMVCIQASSSGGTDGRVDLVFPGFSESATAVVVPLQRWTHLAVSILAGTPSVYINGVLCPLSQVGNGDATSTGWGLGWRTPTNNRAMDGKLADAMAFAGTALSASDIADLYKCYFALEEWAMPAIFFPTTPPVTGTVATGATFLMMGVG